MDRQEEFAQDIACALNENFGYIVARAMDSGDSRGWYVEVELHNEEWAVFPLQRR